MKMRKILAILCAISLVCSMAFAVSAEENETVIYTGDTAASGWYQVAEIYTTVWGGTLDPAFITAGGELSVYVTGTNLWQISFALNGATWAQMDCHVDPASWNAGTMTDLGDNNYVVTFTYDELVKFYGSDDFSTLGAVYIYSNSGDPVTVTKAVYTAAAEEPVPEETVPEETVPEETVPEETVPEETVPEETVPEETVPEETVPEESVPEESVPEESVPEESVPEETTPEAAPPTGVTKIYSGSSAASGWNMTCEVYTTVWGGSLNPLFITEGGTLAVYCNSTDFWQISVALNGAKWAQLDAHVEAAQRNAGTITDLGDGKYMVTFTYDELVAAYGSSDFSTLGAVYVYSNSGGDTVVTSAAYYPAGTNPGTGDPISIVVAIMAISGLGLTAAVAKKKEI